MEHTKNNLIKYLSNNINEENNLIVHIKRLGLERILINELKSINLVEYQKTLNAMLLQKIHNNIIIEETKKIINLTNINKINLVYLKGVFLASQIYNPIEIRKTFDIDVLSKYDDISKLLDLLGALNYMWSYNRKETPMPVTNEMIRNFYCTSDNTKYLNYHVEFFKIVKYAGKNIKILLELHTTPINRKKQYNNFVNEKGIADVFVNRSVRKKLLDCNVSVLEIHDNLLHLMYHFVRHYIHNFREFFAFRKPIALRLDLLHDIAVIIANNKNYINWHIIFERSILMSICGEVLFSLKLLNIIYPSCIPNELINNMMNSWRPGKGDFYDNIIPILLSYDLEKIIFDDQVNILKNIFKLLRANAQIIECPYLETTDQDLDLGFNKIVIDEYNSCIKNSTGTYVSRGTIPNSCFDLSSQIYIWWNKTALYFNFRIYDDKLVFENVYTELGNEVDKIEVLLDLSICTNFKKLMKLFYIIPDKNNGNLCVRVFDDEIKQLLDNNAYTYKINILQDGYEVGLGLNWSYLDIFPVKDMQIPFNIAIWDFDDDNKSKIPTRLSLYGDIFCVEGIIRLNN